MPPRTWQGIRKREFLNLGRGGPSALGVSHKPGLGRGLSFSGVTIRVSWLQEGSCDQWVPHSSLSAIIEHNLYLAQKRVHAGEGSFSLQLINVCKLIMMKTQKHAHIRPGRVLYVKIFASTKEHTSSAPFTHRYGSIGRRLLSSQLRGDTGSPSMWRLLDYSRTKDFLDSILHWLAGRTQCCQMYLSFIANGTI